MPVSSVLRSAGDRVAQARIRVFESADLPERASQVEIDLGARAPAAARLVELSDGVLETALVGQAQAVVNSQARVVRELPEDLLHLGVSPVVLPSAPEELRVFDGERKVAGRRGDRLLVRAVRAGIGQRRVDGGEARESRGIARAKLERLPERGDRLVRGARRALREPEDDPGGRVLRSELHRAGRLGESLMGLLRAKVRARERAARLGPIR
jgi:hypothetical protein